MVNLEENMKKPLNAILTLVILTIATAQGFAIDVLRGEYELGGKVYGFTARVDYKRTASLSWDDGTRGFVGLYNPRPNPAPRCPCDVYERGTRRLSVEFNPQTGEYIGVHYERFP